MKTYIFAVMIIAPMTFVFPDSIEIMPHSKRENVYISQNANYYIIRSTDGTTDKISIHRTVPKSLIYSPDDEREEILKKWEMNKNSTSKQESVEISEEKPKSLPTISIKKPYDPDVYAASEQFRKEKAILDQRERDRKAVIKAAEAKQAEAEAIKEKALADKQIAHEQMQTLIMLDMQANEAKQELERRESSDYFSELFSPTVRELKAISSGLNNLNESLRR
jgi:hypothetical protein